MNSTIKTLYLVSFVFGIFAIVLFFVPFFSFLVALAGVIICTYVFFKNDNEYKRKIITPLILNIIALIIAIIYNLAFFKEIKQQFYPYYDPDTNSYYEPYEPYIDTTMDDTDSLMLDENDLNNLDNSMTDTSNGPGNAPM